MRILMLSQFYPPIIGGIEQHVHNLCAALAARGHDVAVATLWQKGLAETECDGPVRVYRLHGSMHRLAGLLFADPRRSYAPPYPDPELVAGLRRIIAREKPQIVHAHNWLLYSFLPLKRQSGARLVVTLHDYGLRCARWTLLRRGTACNGPGLAKCLACATEAYGLLRGGPIVLANWSMGPSVRRAVDLFLPVSQAVAVGNGLIDHRLPYRITPTFVLDDALQIDAHAEWLAPYMAQLPPPGYLLFVGAFGHHKGMDTLLRAYERAAIEQPLVLIGYETTDYDIGPAAGTRNVLVFHDWPHEAVMAAWQSSGLALIPSVSPDACPTVAMEAMATGHPVIGSRIGGLPDLVVDGETGLLVPPGDADALCAAMKRLIGDPALAERMGQAGRRRFERYRASVVVPAIESAYSELLNSH